MTWREGEVLAGMGTGDVSSFLHCRHAQLEQQRATSAGLQAQQLDARLRSVRVQLHSGGTRLPTPSPGIRSDPSAHSHALEKFFTSLHITGAISAPLARKCTSTQCPSYLHTSWGLCSTPSSSRHLM